MDEWIDGLMETLRGAAFMPLPVIGVRMRKRHKCRPPRSLAIYPAIHSPNNPFFILFVCGGAAKGNKKPTAVASRGFC
jgi:hypothetical protein